MLDRITIPRLRLYAALAALGAGLLASTACQSSSTNILGPSGTKCAVSLPATLPAIGADGGSGTLTVTVAPECTWSASSASEWISITSSPTGQGTGSFAFAVTGNPTAAMRRGALTVGETRVELTQSGASCKYTLTPQTVAMSAEGGQGSVTLAAIEGCQWSAASQAGWIALASSPAGTGSGLIRFEVEPNDGAARTGLIAIADRAFAVNQSGSGSACAVTIDRTEYSVGAAGGADTVTVSAAGACAWNATSQASWITITRGASGAGSGTVALTIAANTGGARVGLVTIAGQTYVVTQAAAAGGSCTYGLGTSQASVPAAGASTTVPVAAPAGCAWTAASLVPWITVSAGAIGNGSGAATLTIAANGGAARGGAVIVAGLLYSVTQAAPDAPGPSPGPSPGPGPGPGCSYNLSSDTQSATAGGGTASIGVSAGSGCAWTAVSQASWITITAGASGSGNGTVALAIGANTGPVRSGTIAVAGRTHTITQAAGVVPCSYAIDPDEAAAASTGGTQQVEVTAGAACAWTAQSNAAWITIANGAAGAGNGTVRLTIAANATAQRTGTATIAGRTFTVTQAAAPPPPPPCTYSLNPTTQAVGPLGGEFTVTITTQAGCAWAASTSENWLQLTGDTSGSGSGTLTYRLGLGLLFSRSGRITIAGQTLTVNQAAVLLSNAR